MDGDDVPEVEGVHRLEVGRPLSMLLFLQPILYGCLALLYQQWWLRAVFIATALTSAALLYTHTWAPRTVVEPGGVRVRELVRWNRIPWGRVRSVDAPNRWDVRQYVKVTTTDGAQTTLPGVATDQAQALQQYWQRHNPTAR